MFANRQQAGQILAAKLKNIPADLVLAVPRGGVVVGYEIAEILKLPLDIIVTRKIGAPHQPELALGAVDPDGKVVWDHELLKQLKFTIYNLQFTIEEAKTEIKRREKIYRQGKKILILKNKRVILVDDGIATGATIWAAVKYLKRHGAKVILAVPVASQEAIDKIVGEVDQSIVLEIPEYFQAVGQFYENFLPISDQEVIQLLS